MKNKEKILYEITNFCNECPSKENCPEEECVLFRIEQEIENNTFQIEITETLQKIVEVKTKNVEEALQQVEEKYKNTDIVLDAGDFIDYEIRVVE